MALDFPTSPGVGQVVTIGGVTWTWDGVKWTAAGTGTGIYLPLTGGTMTGDLILNRDPVVALGAATKQSVDARGAGDNRIINGDMRIDQRGVASGGGAATIGYTVDRWQYLATQASKIGWVRANFNAFGFPYALEAISQSAFTPAVGDTFYFNQTIEADMVSDFAWGTAGAQPVTLSFIAMSSLIGTFSGAIKNTAGTRSYPFTYSLPNANTATKVVIIVPGDTAGTWVLSGNAASILVNFDLGTGATYRGPANAWAATNYNGATGTVSVVGTNGASFYLTGVKLEIGSVATPFNRQSLAKSMADCQRYYQKIGGAGSATVIFQGYASGPSSSGAPAQTIGTNAMRALPTATYAGTWPGQNVTSINLYPGLQTLGLQVFATATGYFDIHTDGSPTTYISLSAEL